VFREHGRGEPLISGRACRGAAAVAVAASHWGTYEGRLEGAARRQAWRRLASGGRTRRESDTRAGRRSGFGLRPRRGKRAEGLGRSVSVAPVGPSLSHARRVASRRGWLGRGGVSASWRFCFVSPGEVEISTSWDGDMSGLCFDRGVAAQGRERSTSVEMSRAATC
jgi:hypothetical protein